MNNRIKELRVRHNMKQSDLAKDLGVSQSTLSNWERGEFEPDKDSLIKLAERFNSTVDFILGRTDKIVSYNTDNIRDSQFNSQRKQLLPEEEELVRIYGILGVKGRHNLLDYAFKLEKSDSW